ncbi:MAG: hypothetical protein LBD23_01065 [Oscillospiraceae bacterium]|jgi:hypothetical protein|nr:hypothetical protein [Oscillospiraceae bacterium]
MKRVFDMSQLVGCTDESKIDGILTSIGIPEDDEQRVNFLYQFMGITQSFTCNAGIGGFTVAQEYSFAKQQLVFSHLEQAKKCVV